VLGLITHGAWFLQLKICMVHKILYRAAMEPSFIKQWLKEHGRDRQWLADRCGVSLPTVHGWLSSGRRMSDSAKKLCEAAILGPYVPKIEFSYDEWVAIQNAARKAGADDISAWLKMLAVEALAADKPIPFPYISETETDPRQKQKLAEDPPQSAAKPKK
jgi:transcriptional regulator with XRE-family HTH domain